MERNRSWNIGIWDGKKVEDQNRPVGNVGHEMQNNSRTGRKVHLLQQERGAPLPIRKVKCSAQNRDTSLSFSSA
jgi:hypothetical protein